MKNDFAKSVTSILNTKWSYSNTYTVQLHFAQKMASKIGWDEGTHGKYINEHIVSVNTPDFSNSPIEIYTGGQFRIQNGKDELYRFSITFKDSDLMTLYRKFLIAYRRTKYWYFDDCAMSVTLTKNKDYYGESDKKLMVLGGCLIEGVSNLDINNNNEAQVAEFTVKFKSTSPDITL